MKIGIFDSGIGGLSVVNKLINTYNAHIVYVADTANMPYGDKSPQEVTQLSESITQFLIKQDVDYIIIACHTISAIAGPYLAAKYKSIHFITMLEAVIPAALDATKNNRIGIMATPATIKHQLHKHALQYLNHQVTIIEQACPTLAPTIEHHLTNTSLVKKRIIKYVTPLIAQDIDTLILGCTHYDVIKKEIHQLVGFNINLICADETTNLLIENDRFVKEGCAQLSCYVSDNREAFAQKLMHIVDLRIPVTIKPLAAALKSDLRYH